MGRAESWCRRFRGCFPPAGRPYELFDTSTFLFLFGLVGYVIFEPAPSVTLALSAPLRVVSETQLGWALCVFAGVGMICAYFPDYLTLGYLLPRIASMFLFLNFVIALITVTVDWSLCHLGIGVLAADIDHSAAFRVAFLYALIFGWATRRLSRDDTA